MKRIFMIRLFIALLSIIVVSGTTVYAQRSTRSRSRTPVRRTVPVKPAEVLYKVDAGTVIRARMNQDLSSKRTVVGTTFKATVTEPVYSDNGVVVIPVGSVVSGRVTSVVAARKGGEPGRIDTTFTSVRLPNGRTRAINGSLTDLTSGKTTSDNEGGVKRDKMEHRKIVFIGGGAAGGAVLGAMVGGGKATAIGAILGAAGGFLGERYMKGPEAEVRSGTEFSIQLNQPISLPRFAEANP